MPTTCTVARADGTTVGKYSFLVVPRAGDWIVCGPEDALDPIRYFVEHVVHVPEGQAVPAETLLIIRSEGQEHVQKP